MKLHLRYLAGGARKPALISDSRSPGECRTQDPQIQITIIIYWTVMSD